MCYVFFLKTNTNERRASHDFLRCADHMEMTILPFMCGGMGSGGFQIWTKGSFRLVECQSCLHIDASDTKKHSGFHIPMT